MSEPVEVPMLLTSEERLLIRMHADDFTQYRWFTIWINELLNRERNAQGHE